MEVVCSQIWNHVLALEKLSDRLDEMQITPGWPSAIVCLKGSVFTRKSIFQILFRVSFGDGVFVSLRDITYMKIPNPWECVHLHVTRESVNEEMQGQG